MITQNLIFTFPVGDYEFAVVRGYKEESPFSGPVIRVQSVITVTYNPIAAEMECAEFVETANKLTTKEYIHVLTIGDMDLIEFHTALARYTATHSVAA
jgi:hypothetical protein